MHLLRCMTCFQRLRFSEVQSFLLGSSRCFSWYRRGYVPPDLEPGQYPFPKRQIPECGLRSFEERLQELSPKKQGVTSIPPVDIGLPYKPAANLPDRPQPKIPELEPLARKRMLKVPLDVIHETSEDTNAPLRRLLSARHHGIFSSLFGRPHFFVPSVDLDAFFVEANGEEGKGGLEPIADGVTSRRESMVYTHPIHTGNLITPERSMSPPCIDLSHTPPDTLWTLVMTCPDEPIGKDSETPIPNEYVHWMVANLCWNTGKNSAEGEEVIPYLPPLPYLGSGYHRYALILYRQENGPVDFTQLKTHEATENFHTERQFHTLEFCRRFQNDLTPTGLGFFQSIWDESVRAYFRNVLNTEEPIFELEWPTPKLPPQEQFPVANSWSKARRHPHGLPLIRERFGVHNDVSFDVYLDRYRDRKELTEELVCERLAAEGNPLDPNEPSRMLVEYPAAVPMPENMPSWWVTQERKRRLRVGRWKHLNGTDG